MTRGRFAVSIGLCLACVAWVTPVSFALGTAAPAEHVLTRAHGGTTVAVHRGDLVVVPLPANAEQWQVEFDATALKSLQPDDRLARPSREGWRFTVIAEQGESVLAVTPISRGAAPPRLEFTIRVER